MHEIVLNWEINECKELMQCIAIMKSVEVIDFGCGFGHYTLPCALALNATGKV